MSDPLTVGIIGGSLSGYAVGIYNLWRRFSRHRVRIFSTQAEFSLTPSNSPNLHDMHVELDLIFYNDTEENVSVTDLIGMLRYDKKSTEELRKLSESYPDGIMLFAERPANFAKVIPTLLAPHESKTVGVVFDFRRLVPSLLDRYGVAHFLGFDRHGTPHIAVVVNEPITEKNPIMMSVATHIDGRKIVSTNVSLREKGPPEERRVSGTLAPMEEKVLEKKFWEA